MADIRRLVWTDRMTTRISRDELARGTTSEVNTLDEVASTMATPTKKDSTRAAYMDP